MLTSTLIGCCKMTKQPIATTCRAVTVRITIYVILHHRLYKPQEDEVDSLHVGHHHFVEEEVHVRAGGIGRRERKIDRMERTIVRWERKIVRREGHIEGNGVWTEDELEEC
jgi:hypothetical protein